jgi:hypothetical protein
LGQFTAQIFEHVCLPLGLDTFGDDLQVETVDEHDDDANDFAGFDIRVLSFAKRSNTRIISNFTSSSIWDVGIRFLP